MPLHPSSQAPSLAKANTFPFLNWRDRPKPLQDEIDREFHNIGSLTSSTWTYNGERTSYDLLSIDEYALLKHLIQTGYPEQKSFYVLDIGAGNFAVNTHLLDCLTKDVSLPDDLEVHLLGVRGETLSPQYQDADLDSSYAFFKAHEPLQYRIKKAGRFTQYDIGQCQIENLLEAFEALGEKGFPIKSLHHKLDLCLSSFTFIHLIDAVGTFLQAYDLIRPKTGMMLSDGFYFSLPEEDDPKYPGKSDNYLLEAAYLDFDVKANINLYWLLNVIGAPFLVNGKTRSGSLNEFIIQKTDEAPLKLPLSYDGIKKHPSYMSRAACYMASFKKNSQALKIADVYVGLDKHVTGDPALFENLKETVFKLKGFRALPRRCYPLNMVFSFDSPYQSKDDLSLLSRAELKADLHVSIRPKKLKAFLFEKRHVSEALQAEFDKRYGLIEIQYGR